MTTTTRELERTRNGARVMERTLEAAAARIKALEDGLRPFAWPVGDFRPDEEVVSIEVDVGCIRRAAALLEKK